MLITESRRCLNCLLSTLKGMDRKQKQQIVAFQKQEPVDMDIFAWQMIEIICD